MAQIESPSIVTDRACGTCAMCCKVLHIPELDKPVGRWCPHVRLGQGCGSYDARPSACRTYFCLWMQDRSFGPEWKPDRAKFVMHWQHTSGNLQLSVDPNFPNAWMRQPYYGWLKAFVRDGAERGQFVFVRVGPRLIVVLPDRDEDIGNVAPEDDVMVARRRTHAGYDYSTEVMRGGRAVVAAG